jgi:hypothetical protein
MMRRGQTIAIVALLGLAGCGGTDEDYYKLVRVTGTVTRNSKPLADARVVFIPDAGNKNSTPTVDTTGPEGNYMPKFKGRTGLAPGKYKVVIEPARELPGGGQMPDQFQDAPVMLQEEQRAQTKLKKMKTRGREEPKIAGTKSEFDAEVPDGTSTTLDFDVREASSAGGSTKK